MANSHHHPLSQWQTFVQSIQTRLLLQIHRPLNRQRRFFLLTGASALIASACASKAQTNNQPTESATVRRVQHAFGETEIPANPTRVILWGYITVEAVVAHGVQPIGVPNDIVNEMPYLSLDGETVVEIGDPGQPNLEKIASLQPDLILTSKYIVREAYPLLAQIAPTVAFDVDSNIEWKELTRLCGEALGKSAETEQLAAAYEAKLQAIKSKFSQKATQPQISVIYFYPGRTGAMGTETFAGSVLADAGIARPPSQAQAQGPQNLSLESLDLLDGDVIFVIAPQSDTEAAQESRTEFDLVKAHPLWSQLKAVQTKQVYEVGSHWAIGSYIAANLILDDLLKHLVERQ